MSAELHLKVGLLVEAHAQVHRGGDVGDGAHGVDGPAQILLDVVRLLGLYRHAYVEVDLVADVAQLHVGIVTVLGTFRIAAQGGAQIRFVGIVEKSEQRCPLAVGVQHAGKSLIAVVGKVVSGGIVLLVTVPIAIVQLQKQTLLTEASPVAVSPAAAKGASRTLKVILLIAGRRLEEQ